MHTFLLNNFRPASGLPLKGVTQRGLNRKLLLVPPALSPHQQVLPYRERLFLSVAEDCGICTE